jgi:hypothetical protein
MFDVIGPYFFYENNQAITMDSEHYCKILQTFLPMDLRKMRQRVTNVWFDRMVQQPTWQGNA